MHTLHEVANLAEPEGACRLVEQEALERKVLQACRQAPGLLAVGLCPGKRDDGAMREKAGDIHAACGTLLARSMINVANVVTSL